MSTSMEQPVSKVVTEFSNTLTTMLNFMTTHNLSDYVDFFKKLSDELCTKSNGVYSRKKHFTTRDEVVVRRETRKCVIAWRGNKIQRDKRGDHTVNYVNYFVTQLENISKTIPNRFKQPSSDFRSEYSQNELNQQTHELENLLCMLQAVPSPSDI